MIIKNLHLKNKYIMAPMAGITDLSFRLLCKEQGCGLVYTEMVSAKALYYKDKKTNDLLKTNNREKPVGIQIFGSDSKIIAHVVENQINDLPFDLIDFNCGCPAPKITKNGEGAALLKDPKRIGEIVGEMVKVSTKPITVKIRIGWDDKTINAIEVAKIIEDAGASAITVHGRTRKQLYSGKSDWSIIAQVKKNTTIPVIGNGDVTNLNDAKRLVEISQCDGIMIGRSALGNPWIFQELVCDRAMSINSHTKIDMIIRHMENMLSIKPEHIVVGEIRKHIAWYTKGLRNSSDLRNSINTTKSIEEVKNILNIFAKDYKI